MEQASFLKKWRYLTLDDYDTLEQAKEDPKGLLCEETPTLGIEVKSAESVTFKDTKSMRVFLKAHPEVKKGMIIYAGSKVFQIATNIYAVPWCAL